MILGDLRSAVRRLGQNPGFASLAILTLVLGLGTTTAVVTVVDNVLFRSLPYPEPDRLVRVWPEEWFSKQEILDFQRHARAFGDVAAYYAWDKVALADQGPPVAIESSMVSASFFEVLGVVPELGRGFRVGEDQPGGELPVVLAHSLWRRQFSSSPDVVGRRVQLDGQPHVVVGVMPKSFRYPRNEVELWRPAVFDPTQDVDFYSNYLQLIARLPDDGSVEQAQDDGRRVAEAMRAMSAEEYRADYGSGSTVLTLHRDLVGDVRPALLSLLGAVALVMTIAIVNVANLLLARGGQRTREFAVRLALGAGRGRLARLVLVEGALLAVLGGALSVPFAWGLLRVLLPALPPDLPRLGEIVLDARILAIAFSLVMVAALGAALVPALRAARDGVQHGLRDGGDARVAGGRKRVREGLVVAEVALAVVLVSGAGLLAKSLKRLSEVPLGLRTERVVSFQPMLPQEWFDDYDRARRAYTAILDRIADLPAVESAGGIHMIPVAHQGFNGQFEPEGWPAGRELPIVNWRVVTPGYFQTVEVPLLRGRLLSDRDVVDHPDVAVVNQRLARSFWGSEDPIGRRFRISLEGGGWITVAGVVGDVRQGGAGRAVRPEIYRPLAQSHRSVGISMIVRSQLPADALVPIVREAVREVEPNVPIASAKTMQTIVRESAAQPRLVASLIGALAGLALFLGALGTYGVLAADVGSRTREIGVRMAVGARPSEVLHLVLRQAIGVVALGLLVGLPLALGLSRYLASQLFQVSPSDPPIYAAVTLVLLTVGALAAAVPARRAAATDPLKAIRHE